VRELKIGYWPLSANLKSPGDRRRVVFWAKARGHTLVTDLSKKVDVIIASERSDFNSALLVKKNIPIVFDLVDAYLSPQNLIEDFARGLTKKIAGQISGEIRPFSHHVKDFCSRSNAVICSSPEQEALIKPFNANTCIILDSHEEIPFIAANHKIVVPNSATNIIWEGQPATIRGVRGISPVLSQLSKIHNLQFDFVTDEKYFQVLNRYFERKTVELLKRDLFGISSNFRIINWSIDNLTRAAQKATVAMIPISLNVPMQSLKPENRLLIMWRLGLPCLTSPSAAYIRVGKLAGVNAVCDNSRDWLGNFERLLTDCDFAKDEVLRGQNYLQENHTKAILLKKWDTVFESVLG
jgi:hypothetical protein